ncbi:MAG: EAL domain-containing protein [Planctomycetota bacterium]
MEEPRTSGSIAELIDALPEMVHSIDGKGALVGVSDVWLQTLGYERDEVLGRKSVEFLTERSRAYAEQVVLPRFRADGRIRDIPYQFVHKNGAAVDVLLSAVGRFDDAGDLAETFAISTLVGDVTRSPVAAALVRAAVAHETVRNFVSDGLKLLSDHDGLCAGMFVDLRDSGPCARGSFGFEDESVPQLRDLLPWVLESQRLDRLLVSEDGLRADGEVSLCPELPDGWRIGVGVPVHTPDSGAAVVGILVLMFGGSRPFHRQLREASRTFASLIGLLEQRQRVSEMRQRESDVARITLESIADGVVSVDHRGRIAFVNPAAERLAGLDSGRMVGSSAKQALHMERLDDGSRIVDPVSYARLVEVGSGHDRLVRWISATGEHSEVEIYAHEVPGTGVSQRSFVLTLSDVTRARQLSRELDRRATEDPLSGLINRTEFERRLRESVRTTSHAPATSLGFIDLDQFKVVNDTCGHAAGDILLRQVAGILRAALRRGDVIGRLGGDEFGLLLPDCDAEAAVRVGEQLLAQLRDFRFCHDDKIFQIGASIGIVEIRSDATLADLMSGADRACYRAKELGRNRVEIGSLDGNDDQARELMWVPRIQRALLENRMELHGQKVYRVNAREVVAAGLEVLVRKRTLAGELIPPSAFLPAVERYNLANQLDRWVIRHTLELLAEHSEEVDRLEFVTINLSGQTIGDEHFCDTVLEDLAQSGVDASKIGFEITETSAIANLSAARRFIDLVGQAGARFLLDDFGSGLSSFAYLKELPVDQVKVDGRFVANMTEDPADFAVVRSIDEIAKLTGKTTIAEHVESTGSLELLRALGVDFAQGYALHEPEPLASAIAEWSSGKYAPA